MPVSMEQMDLIKILKVGSSTKHDVEFQFKAKPKERPNFDIKWQEDKLHSIENKINGLKNIKESQNPKEDISPSKSS